MSDPLLKKIRVRCDEARAFEVFAEEVDLWWPQGHRRIRNSRLVLEARVGGRFFEQSDSGEELALGEVLVCSPPHELSFTWNLGTIDKPTRVDISFKRDGDDTVVSVRHSIAESGLGDAWPQRVILFNKGWKHVLDAHADFVAHER